MAPTNWERLKKYKITYVDGTTKVFFCTYTAALNIFSGEGAKAADLQEVISDGDKMG